MPSPLASPASTAEPTDDRATDESAPKLALATAVDNLAQSLAALGENRTQQLEDLTGKIDALAAAVTEQTATAAAEKEALEKQKEEREKAVSEAQEEKRDADDLVRRAEEGVEASTVVVAQATAAADQFEQALGARQQQLASLEQSGRRPCVAAGPTTDGKHVWFADQGGNVHVLGIDGRSTAAWNATGELDLAAACVTTDGRIDIAGETPQAALQSWAIRGQWALRQTIGGPSAADSLLQGRVLALDFSPDGRLLAIGGGIAAQEGQVVLWNLEQKQIERALDKPHDDVVLGLQFSRDGTRLATSSADRLMKVFDVEDGRMLKVFEGHAHHVLDVAWRASGLQLATGRSDKTVKVWDFSTGEQIRTLPAGKEEVIGVEFLGVGSLLAVAAGDGVVRIYNADDGKQARAITSGGGYLFTSAADSAGDKILVGGARQFWQVYSGGDGAKLHGPVGE